MRIACFYIVLFGVALAVINNGNAQNTIVFTKGRTDGGSGLTLPTPTIQLLLDEGSGTTSNNTGSTGDTNDCASLANFTWVEDPASSGRYVIQRSTDAAHFPCGTFALSGTATAWSMGVWINPSSSATNRTVVGVDSTNTAGGGTHAWSFRYLGSTGVIQYQMTNTSAAADIWDSDASAITNGSWNHALVVVSGCSTTTSMDCSAALYVNGSPVNFTLTTDSTGTRRVDTGFFLQFGQVVSIAAMLNKTDKLQVWLGTALTATEVATAYAQGR